METVKVHKVVLLLGMLLTAVAPAAFGQPDLPNPPASVEYIPAGYFVIAMDNDKQNLSGTFFNIRAYGLANAMLQDGIPVKWAIRAGKAHDGIDFSANAERIAPSYVGPRWLDFRAGPFLVPDTVLPCGLSTMDIITAFGNDVAVYKLTQTVSIDVRYTLTHRPKVAVFNNGGNQVIHTKILDHAAIPDYDVIDAANMDDLRDCYTFASEPHWDTALLNMNVLTGVRNFLMNGGNFLAQCEAVETYENNGFYMTTSGIVKVNAAVVNRHHNMDMAYMQVHGNIADNEPGSVRNWVLAPGSAWLNPFYRGVTHQGIDTFVTVGIHLRAPFDIGGNMFYLGGHDYSRNKGKPTIFNPASLEHVNALRLYLNAVFIPALNSAGVWANAGPDGNISSCNGEVVLGCEPTGPSNSTITWAPPAGLNCTVCPNPVASPDSTTTYMVTVTKNNCVAYDTVVVTVGACIPDVELRVDTVCPGTCGLVLAIPVQGTPTYTYTWSDSALSGPGPHTVCPTTSTTYFVTMTDATNQTSVSSGTFIVHTPPAVLVNAWPVSCNGSCDGMATAGGMGNGPLTYQWDNGATTDSLAGLCPGAYRVTVTDVNGCSDTASVAVPDVPVLIVSDSVMHVPCNGGNNGLLTVTVSGGVPAYTYLWSNGVTSRTAANLTAGSYTVTVTDARGCLQVLTQVVTEPPAPNLTAGTTGVTCFGASNGTATLNPAGGTPPYTYLWSNGSTSLTASGLPPGAYQVTMTDANGCTAQIAVAIVQPADLLVSGNPASPLCSGGSSGTADVTTAGGTPPYSYLWSNGATSEDLTGLTAGTYTLTVTDGKGCTDSVTLNLTAPAPLLAAGSGTDAVCAGACNGTAAVSATGGTLPLTYLWDDAGSNTASTLSGLCPGTYNVTVADANGCMTSETVTVSAPPAVTGFIFTGPLLCNGRCDGSASVIAGGGMNPYTYAWSGGGSQTTETATGLCAGTYTVTITDAAGCTLELSSGLTEPPVLLPDGSATPADCGSPNGTGSVSVTGGTPPYAYLWINAGGQTAATITGLFVGNYRVVVTDANGCTDSLVVTVDEVGDLPPVTVTSTPIACKGSCNGTATAGAGGGVPPYTYLWSDGRTTPMLTGLCAGTYEVVMTDSTGCKGTFYTILAEPAELIIAATGADVNCSGDNSGATTVTAAGGTAPYSFLWSNGSTSAIATGLPGGAYSVTVTDANGCSSTGSATVAEPPVLTLSLNGSDATCAGIDNGSAITTAGGGTPSYRYLWSTGVTTASLSGLAPGSYTVTLTDNRGCTTADSLTISAPLPFGSTMTVTDVTCHQGNDGGISVTNSGGTVPYIYLWNDGQTTAGRTGLSAGTYLVTVTDAAGCRIYLDTLVTEPQPIASLLAAQDITCFGRTDGIIDQQVTGDRPPFTFTWSSGHSSEDLSGLPAGTYRVTVTDSRGCTDSASVTIYEPPALALMLSKTDVGCAAGSDGSIGLTASGGLTPYTISWSNGSGTGNLVNLPAGFYTVTVTDANGCTITDSVTLVEPQPVSVSHTAQDPLCYKSNDGSINISPAGGTAPYVYTWSNGQTSEDLSGLVAGTYTVTVSDINGCNAVAIVSLINRPLLSLLTTSSSITCNSLCDGSATAGVTGGTPPYTYAWNDTQAHTAVQATGLCAGVYEVCVTDAGGCKTCADATVTEPPPLVLSLSSTDENCRWLNGTATATPSGGTPPYTYLWNDAPQTTAARAIGLPAGTYGVTITDANGCADSGSVGVTFTWSPTPLFAGSDVCVGDSTQFIFSSTGNYVSCFWDFGDGSPDDNTCGDVSHLYATPGNYTVKHAVADYLGCSDTFLLNVAVHPPPQVCLSGTTAGCVPVTVTLGNCTPGSVSCFWEFGDGATSTVCNPVHSFQYPGCYDVSLTVVDSLGCTDKATETCFVEGYPWPAADFTADPWEVTILNPLINFIDRSTDANGWIWWFGDGDSSDIRNPIHTYRDTGSYWVTLILTNQYGCTDTIVKPIRVKDITSIYIPNAFTPNSDGTNEYFTVKQYGFCEFEMLIFDRWGNEIFRTASLKGWDGTANGGTEIAQEDVYVWLVRAVDCYGKAWNRIGHVTLIR